MCLANWRRSSDIKMVGDEVGGGSNEFLAYSVGYSRKCCLSLVSQSLSLTAYGK